MTDLDNGADLRERFDHAMHDLSAPDNLTSAVLTDGHRLRRRRRVLTVSTGVAAAAVITALVAANLGGSAPSTGPEVATQPPPSTEGPAPDVPAPSDGPDADPFPDFPEGWWDQPADQLLENLEEALPDGVEVVDGDAFLQDPGSGITLSGPAGPGGFQVMLYMPDLEEIPDPVTTTDAAGNEGTAIMAEGRSNLTRVKCGHQARYTDTCEEILNSDGVTIGRVDTILQDGTITFYEATLLGPEDGLVYLSAWNAVDEKPGPDTPTSAAVPPLTLEQLRAMVQDPAWTSYQP